MTEHSAAAVVPVACRRRSHAGKPSFARVLCRPRVDYRMASTTVGHGCTMDADSGATDHAARSRRGTSLRSASGSQRSACSHAGWRPVPRPRLTQHVHSCDFCGRILVAVSTGASMNRVLQVTRPTEKTRLRSAFTSASGREDVLRSEA